MKKEHTAPKNDTTEQTQPAAGGTPGAAHAESSNPEILRDRLNLLEQTVAAQAKVIAELEARQPMAATLESQPDPEMQDALQRMEKLEKLVREAVLEKADIEARRRRDNQKDPLPVLVAAMQRLRAECGHGPDAALSALLSGA